jgi:hypothetical protein
LSMISGQTLRVCPEGKTGSRSYSDLSVKRFRRSAGSAR